MLTDPQLLYLVGYVDIVNGGVMVFQSRISHHATLVEPEGGMVRTVRTAMCVVHTLPCHQAYHDPQSATRYSTRTSTPLR